MFLTALAIVVRFATLSARGFWLDEAITVDLVDGSLGELVERLRRYSLDQPPLYYLLAWGWAKAFGTGELAMRSLPAILGGLTVPVAYLAGAQLRSPRAGLVAGLLTALSPLVIWHSQDARPYALVILLGGLSFAVFLRLLVDRRAWVLALWVLVSVLAMAAHYAVGFLVVGEVLWLLFARRGLAVLVALAAVLVAVLLLQDHRTGGGSLGTGFWTQNYSLTSRLLQVPAQLLVGYQPPLQVVTAVVAAVLAGAIIALLAVRADARERASAAVPIFVCAVGVGLPMMIAATGQLGGLTTRYLVGAWVPLVVAGAAALVLERGRRLGFALTALFCVLFVAIGAASAWKPKFDREDWRGAAGAIGQPGARQAIVVSPSEGVLPIGLYRPRARELPERGLAVRRIALLALPRPYRTVGEQPRPPRPASVEAPLPGFVEVGRRLGELYTIVFFRSRRPRLVTPAALTARGLGDLSSGVLVEGASAG